MGPSPTSLPLTGRSGSDLVLHLDAGSSGSSAALAQKPPSAASQGGYGGHDLRFFSVGGITHLVKWRSPGS